MGNNNKTYKFIIFCLEHYRYFRDIAAMDALSTFRKAGVFEYLTEGYDVLHTQSRDYIVRDIDEFILNHSTK